MIIHLKRVGQQFYQYQQKQSHNKFKEITALVSDCFNSNFSTISWREQVNFQRDDDEICFEVHQHT
jgi:hypothetical protein